MKDERGRPKPQKREKGRQRKEGRPCAAFSPGEGRAFMKAQPCGEIACLAELPSIPCRCDNSGRAKRADARDGHETTDRVMLAGIGLHARDLIAAWVADYNTARPHSALGYQTPAGFALNLTTAIARPAARDESSARRAIAQPTPKGVNQLPAPVAAG